MKSQTVFISSTYSDLIPHRKSIWETLQNFHVKISGMEKFGARNEAPLETCLKEVKSCDIFIGIIGMRYGSIDDSSYKSFSRLEYEKAREEKKKILIYLIDTDKSLIKPSHVDCENSEHLIKFKELVLKNHTIETFISKEDLINKIYADLKRIIDELRIKYFRPKKIDAEFYTFKMGKEKWLAVLGLKFGVPHEIYAMNSESGYRFMIPKGTEKGWVIQNQDEYDNPRYDFQYIDKDGYKTTIEGLFKYESNYLVALVSKLLEKELPIELIIEIIDELDINEQDSKVRNVLKKTLLKKNN